MFENIQRLLRRHKILPPTVNDALDAHIERERHKVDTYKISDKTLRSRMAIYQSIRETIGRMPLESVCAGDVSDLVLSIKDDGHTNKAALVRGMIIRLYYEALETGMLRSGYNPAKLTRAPRVRVLRSRLTLEQWLRLFAQAGIDGPEYMQHAMLLALITGQRRADVVKMRYDDIIDDYLHITQQKTDTQVMIPLDLKLDAIGVSLRQIVNLCQQANTGCPYLIHSELRPYRKVHVTQLSRYFVRSRQNALGAWTDPDTTPPSWHEQRSLSERLYRDQGIDTRRLMGHRQQSMTDKYNSIRRLKEVMVVPLNIEVKNGRETLQMADALDG